ncbi:exopolysaccharide biosynthesis polyprenyl glycosylphosphotransferase [Sphingobium sp. Sx8-8]|uniref:exopolysaccharide biosynthesis polyprenyl glycosylphosphotransferase n=1 Tax=Sphingobium sp. Sx8-8 TaxID=2933617 RepID=UPI001F594493|nr:exopolysaccharide biosynthesis polyprenyl glycosylphosphotransferase [Sphingobium sp. Sx8-8]
MNVHATINPAEIPSGEGGSLAKAYLRAQLILVLFGTDLLALVFACTLAMVIWQSNLGIHLSDLMPALTLILLYSLTGFALRAFAGEALLSPVISVRGSLLSILGAAGLLLTVLYAVGASEHFSRTQFGLSVGLSIMFLAVSRTCMTRYAVRVLNGDLYSVVYINEIDQSHIFGQALPFTNKDELSPHEYHAMARYIGKADRVVIHCLPERRSDWAHMLQGMNVHAEVIAAEFAGAPVVAVGEYGNQPTLVVARGPFDMTERSIKRAFDIAFSVVAIIALLPLLLLVAIAVKLSSAGPVLFKQPRLGRQNRIFDIYKFRSMRVQQADLDGARSATRDDDRITAVGHLLRRTSIDELPQLFNVLLGDMSVVGPRPHALYSKARDRLFWEVDQRYWYRHACKPGITGLAQVRGHRGATHREQDLTDRLLSDLEYLNKWSLWMDLAILLRTMGVMIHRNAF